MKIRVVLISFSLLVNLPAAMVAAEKVSQPGAGDQRAACDAQCRENYQNNSAALQACLRDCGAMGPASPAGTKVKGSKSNSSERLASPPAPPPVPAEAANLNLSKSNINRVAEPPAGAPSVEATTVKGSKSNSDNRTVQPSGAGAPVDEAAAVKSSKSNTSDRQAAPDAGETAPLEPEGDAPSDG